MRPHALSAGGASVRFGLAASCALAFAFATRPAAAQIVNVQPLVAQDRKAGLKVTFEGSIDARSGNTRLLLLAGSSLVHYLSGPNLFFVLLRGELGKTAGNEFARKHFEHVRYRRVVAGPVDFEFYAQYQEDVFRRLAVRALVGAGPRLRAVDWTWFQVAFGCTPFVEYEQLASGVEPDASEHGYDVRLSTYSVIAVQPSERLKVSQTIYVQPRVDRFRDARVLHEVEGLAVVNKHLAFKGTISSMYDSRPPFGVAPLDTTVKSTVQITF